MLPSGVATVMEEVDADKMLSEMIRVTKPGGRIGVIVRAFDMPRAINVPVSTELKAKLELPEGGDEGSGSASASLYQRFHRFGLIRKRNRNGFARISPAPDGDRLLSLQHHVVDEDVCEARFG